MNTTTLLLVVVLLLVVFLQVSKTTPALPAPTPTEDPQPQPSSVVAPQQPSDAKPPPVDDSEPSEPPQGPLPAEMEGEFRCFLGEEFIEEAKSLPRRYPTLVITTKNTSAFKAKASIAIEGLPSGPVKTTMLPVSVIVDMFNEQQPPQVVFDAVLPSDENVFDVLEAECGIYIERKYDNAVQPILTFHMNNPVEGTISPASVNTRGYVIENLTYDPITDKLLKTTHGKAFNDLVLYSMTSNARIIGYENSFKQNSSYNFTDASDWTIAKGPAPLELTKWPIQATSKSVNSGNRYIRGVAWTKGFDWTGTYGGHGGRKCRFGQKKNGATTCTKVSGNWNCCDRDVYKKYWKKTGFKTKSISVGGKGNNISMHWIDLGLCNFAGGIYGGGNKECPDWWKLKYNHGNNPSTWGTKIQRTYDSLRIRGAGELNVVLTKDEPKKL